jgi:predicted DNA-binding transcriptional regulator YafY
MAQPRASTEESRERKVALFWTLCQAHETRRPITQQEIVENLMIDELPVMTKVPRRKRAYDGNDNAHRQKFERDKAAIRDLGFEILTERNEFDVDAYSIDPSSVYVPAIEFSADELDVVTSAMALLGLGGGGVSRLFLDGPTAGAGQELSPILLPLTRAMATSRPVRFRYRKSGDEAREREIVPLDVLVRQDRTYVIGMEPRTSEVKGFLVTRIESVPVVGSGSVHVSEEARRHADAWIPKPGEALSVPVRFVTSESYARLISAERRAVTTPREDGDVDVEIEFDSPASARRAILSYGDHVRRVRPRELREELIGWLKQVNSPRRKLSSPSFEVREGRTDSLGQSLQLIAAVYQSADPLRASQLAERFDLDVELVRSIMSRIMSMQYIRDPHRYLVHIEPGDDVDEPEDPFYARSYSYLASGAAALAPLTWRDALELLVALKEAAAAHPSAALERVIAKIEGVVQANVRVEDVELEYLSHIRDAIDRHQQLKISYWSAAQDRASDRWVEPRAMASRNGRWYFRAWCSTREAWLTFRVDRVLYVHAVGPGPGGHPEDVVVRWSDLGVDDGEEVTVAVTAPTRWLFEAVPNARFAPADEGVDAVRLRVSDERFLDQLLVEAGPGAWVIDPPSSRAGRDLAKRMSGAL